MKLYTSYLICSIPHAGGELLSTILTDTGLAGRPRTYYRAPSHTMEDLLPKHDVADFNGLQHEIMRLGTTPNGVFGARIGMDSQAGHLDNLVEVARRGAPRRHKNMPGASVLSSVFPNLHYIWVTRRNKIRLAIDRWLQEQHGPDILPDILTDAKAGPRRHEGAQYDFASIDRYVQEAVALEADWALYFDQADVRPFTIVYEDLMVDYEADVERIFALLEIPIPASFTIPESPLSYTAFPELAEWEQRYREDRMARWTE